MPPFRVHVLQETFIQGYGVAAKGSTPTVPTSTELAQLLAAGVLEPFDPLAHLPDPDPVLGPVRVNTLALEDGELVVVDADAPGGFDTLPAATPYAAPPNPDTEAGSKGASNTFALGDHSHARSSLYDGFGHDVVHVVPASGANVTIPSPRASQVTAITLTADCLLTFPAAEQGLRFRLVTKQNTPGGHEMTFPGTVGWVGGQAPTFTLAPGGIDVTEFICFDGSTWFGFALGLNATTPPPPLEVVQTAAYIQPPDWTTMTFPDPVTPGNAILLFGWPVDKSAWTPTGGGIDNANWTMVGEAANSEDTHVRAYVGVNSAGGSGSEVVHLNQSFAMMIEIQGLALSLTGIVDDFDTYTFDPPSVITDIPAVPVTASTDGMLVGTCIAAAASQIQGFEGEPIGQALGNNNPSFNALYPVGEWLVTVLNDGPYVPGSHPFPVDRAAFAIRLTSIHDTVYSPEWRTNGNGTDVAGFSFTLKHGPVG